MPKNIRISEKCFVQLPPKNHCTLGFGQRVQWVKVLDEGEGTNGVHQIVPVTVQYVVRLPFQPTRPSPSMHHHQMKGILNKTERPENQVWALTQIYLFCVCFWYNYHSFALRARTPLFHCWADLGRNRLKKNDIIRLVNVVAIFGGKLKSLIELNSAPKL